MTAVVRAGSRPRHGTFLMARTDLLPSLEQILATRTLTEWAAEHPLRDVRHGRAPTWVVPLAADVTVVVRHAWHGGLLAPLTRDRWRAPGRAEHEVQSSDRLREQGVRTPTVLAWASYAAGAGLIRYDVCTQFIPRARDLATLFRDSDRVAALDAVRAVSTLLQTLSTARARHADLNIKNVLVADDGVAWVLDVDRVSFDTTDPATVHAANWARLLRSATKWQRTLGERIPLAALRDAAQTQPSVRPSHLVPPVAS
jgi:3-deoxy-D-manno-octulosonic acid kinase